MSTTYNITQTEFDNELIRIVEEEMKTGELLSIPGIYEILAENLNNEILENLGQKD